MALEQMEGFELAGRTVSGTSYAILFLSEHVMVAPCQDCA